MLLLVAVVARTAPAASASSNRTGTLATCEVAHESLDEENLDLEISCRVSKAADAALLVVRNHGGDAATLDAGRALVSGRSG